MKTITVNVTERDIETSHRVLTRYPLRRTHTMSCPVARALHRYAPFRGCIVGGGGRVIDDHYNVETPPKVAAFIRRFDAGKPVEPFSFEIEVPA